MSSPSSFTSSQQASFYVKDQLQVQKELIQAIDHQYLPILQDVFRTHQWLYQEEPLPRDTVKTLCPKDPGTRKFYCVFCPTVSFAQSTKAVEHIQQHLGMRPFDCMTWRVFLLPPFVHLTIVHSHQTFLRKHELKGHAKTHASPDNVPCPNEW
jgi:hypothetical protein